MADEVVGNLDTQEKANVAAVLDLLKDDAKLGSELGFVTDKTFSRESFPGQRFAIISAQSYNNVILSQERDPNVPVVESVMAALKEKAGLNPAGYVPFNESKVDFVAVGAKEVAEAIGGDVQAAGNRKYIAVNVDLLPEIMEKLGGKLPTINQDVAAEAGPGNPTVTEPSRSESNAATPSISDPLALLTNEQLHAKIKAYQSHEAFNTPQKSQALLGVDIHDDLGAFLFYDREQEIELLEKIAAQLEERGQVVTPAASEQPAESAIARLPEQYAKLSPADRQKQVLEYFKNHPQEMAKEGYDSLADADLLFISPEKQAEILLKKYAAEPALVQTNEGELPAPQKTIDMVRPEKGHAPSPQLVEDLQPPYVPLENQAPLVAKPAVMRQPHEANAAGIDRKKMGLAASIPASQLGLVEEARVLKSNLPSRANAEQVLLASEQAASPLARNAEFEALLAPAISHPALNQQSPAADEFALLLALRDSLQAGKEGNFDTISDTYREAHRHFAAQDTDSALSVDEIGQFKNAWNEYGIPKLDSADPRSSFEQAKATWIALETQASQKLATLMKEVKAGTKDMEDITHFMSDPKYRVFLDTNQDGYLDKGNTLSITSAIQQGEKISFEQAKDKYGDLVEQVKLAFSDKYQVSGGSDVTAAAASAPVTPAAPREPAANGVMKKSGSEVR